MRILLVGFWTTAFVALTPCAHAATPDASTATLSSSEGRGSHRLAYSAAYFGEWIFHPGLEAGLEYRLSAKDRGRTRGGSVLFASNLASYVHVRNHTGLRLDAELGYRYTFRSGFFADGFVGAGYLHTFLGAPVYTVSDDGKVERVADWGRPAFMPLASLGCGLQLGEWAPFLRLESFGQYPYNRHVLPHFALLLGLRVSDFGVRNR